MTITGYDQRSGIGLPEGLAPRHTALNAYGKYFRTRQEGYSVGLSTNEILQRFPEGR